MAAVTRYTLRQAVFMNVIFIVMMVAGAFSLMTTPIENVPPVDIGKVFIHVTYYGASAEDVETLVSKKIEEAVDGMDNVEYVQSRTRRSFSSTEVKFMDDTDYEDLYDELRFRVQNIQGDLPPEADEPEFFYINSQFWMPVIIVNLAGDLPNRSLALLADELKSRVRAIDGVREVGLRGKYDDEFHVTLNPERLRYYGITFEQAARAIEAANVKIPTGRLGDRETEYMLDAGRRLSSQREVLDVIVRRDGDGNFVRVRDLVTSARLWYREPNFINTVNGMQSIALIVKKENSANAIRMAEDIKRLAAEFEDSHRADGLIVRLTNDSTIEIKDSIRTLGGSLLLGMALVTGVLWLTLGFRNAMLTAIGIPFSFLCTLIFVKVSGQSINTISLFSFVLVSGIIVDDAVIILENIYRHLQSGKDLRESITTGVDEVMLPVISSAVTTIFAFMPLLIMTGSTGDFFAVIPLTVSFALMASLLEALFILPVHVLDWGPRSASLRETYESDGGDAAPGEHLRSGMFGPLWKIYLRLLDILLAHKIKAFAAFIIAFVVAVAMIVLSMTGIVPLINVQFFPGSYFRYHVAFKLPPGTSIEKSDEVVRDISNHIMSLGEGQALAAVGTAGMYEGENYQWNPGHNHGQVVVTLPEEGRRKFPDNPGNDPYVHLEYIRRSLERHLRDRYGYTAFMPEVTVFPENTGPPTGKAVNIRVTGEDRELVARATDDLVDHLRSGPEFADLVDMEVNRSAQQKVARYLPNVAAAYERGVPPSAVTALVAGALNGRRAGRFRATDEEVDLVVRMARADDPGNAAGIGIRTPSDVLDIPAVEHSYAPIYLRDLVDLSYVSEPSIRMRYNGKPALTVAADIRAGSKLTASRAQLLVSDYFETVADKYPGVTVAFGGEFETTRRTFTSLGFALAIAVLCIYTVLAAQFKDYFQPAIIISGILFAVIGVVFGMFVTRSTFTVGSFIAVVGLAGVAVNDSLILIDFINVRRRAGMHMRRAVIDACSTRMRPVLITTITTIFGLLPMAIGIPRKSIAWAPMATAFVTGLSSATILALLLIPVEYELSEELRMFLRRVTGRKEDGGSYDR